MRVGVPSSGIAGQTPAAGFLKHGCETMVGTREPAKPAEWRSAHPDAQADSFSETAAFGEAVVPAVKGAGPVEALRAREPLCMLWCIPGFLRNEWGHAFRLPRN